MEKILIQIKDNNMYFKKKASLSDDQKNLLNTNIISDNELIFSDEYIITNITIITAFLTELAIKQKINTVYLYKSKVVIQFLEIIKNVDSIKNLVIKDEVEINNKMVESMKTNKYLETISVYSMHDFFTDYLDDSGKRVEVRHELFLTSDFAKCNELNKYSTLMYKKIINISLPFSKEDQKDFKNFIEVNKYLNVIHINKCTKNDLEKLVNFLELYKEKNVTIVIHDNISDINLAQYIKKINTSKVKKDNINIKVSYSDAYLKKNFLPQTNLNILKTCVALIILLVVSTYTYYIAANYFDLQSDKELKEYINDVIETADTEIIIEQIEKETEKVVVNEYIASLLTINPDVTGWIYVPGTDITYPVLKGTDNKHYLTHDIENKYTRYGSIFMNNVNSSDFTDDNTTLFGHNFYGSKVMFSTLNQIDNEAWLSNPENHIITVDTLHESLKYKIFSYYITNVTSDYLTVNYYNELNRLDFYYMLESRSKHDFGVELNYDDKILTLSTCANSGTQRFVVHAVLVE